MDRSQYLVQALAGMAQQPQAQAAPGPDLAGMADAMKQRKSWEAQNPGQSYMRHGFEKGIESVQGLPGRLAGVPGQLAQVPGQLGQVPGQLAGLFSLGGKR